MVGESRKGVDARTLVGKPVEWRSEPIGFLKREWRLYCEGNVVATLEHEKLLTWDRQATFEGVSIKMIHDKDHDRLMLKHAASGEIMGTVGGFKYGITTYLGQVRRIWTVVLKDGTKFTIELQHYPHPDGAFFRSVDGKELAKAWPAGSTHTALTFMLLGSDVPIDPWLMAILSLFFINVTLPGGGAF